LAGSAGFPPVEVALSRPTSECGTDLPPTTSTAAAGMAVAVPLHALALSTDTTTASTTAAAAVASAAIASFAAAALASALATTVMATTARGCDRQGIRGILLSADALPTPTTDASEVAPDKRDFAKRRRAAGHRRHRHGDPPPLGLSRLTCPLRWARPAVTAKMRHHQRLQGHALRRCSAGVERDCRISVLWTPPATQTCTVVHV
jgi:hypothetical protein